MRDEEVLLWIERLLRDFADEDLDAALRAYPDIPEVIQRAWEVRKLLRFFQAEAVQVPMGLEKAVFARLRTVHTGREFLDLTSYAGRELVDLSSQGLLFWLLELVRLLVGLIDPAAGTPGLA
ncbi:hypothetical protein EI42_00239 [Thermosporothrix hazakensis]|jgi:hypothetical protein|uniref:Uncharacterized protein n=2 Tax=Thermosporothrix TaxID=768650 RepID=A0A326UPC0_THEHA|nr:hypothetical protein [Thermosporothrix hazakensis]PZW36069.1 hypothetical protein EI42_00239 [Thermosporothrix hazakensis]BBH88535.1 hypothetical protein KTC_32860 [Thermosporothrix sp. COM3]GCE46720.1 hypothetical protein KTH_15890 [Thermosporothrix hazakensis]